MPKYWQQFFALYPHYFEIVHDVWNAIYHQKTQQLQLFHRQRHIFRYSRAERGAAEGASSPEDSARGQARLSPPRALSAPGDVACLFPLRPIIYGTRRGAPDSLPNKGLSGKLAHARLKAVRRVSAGPAGASGVPPAAQSGAAKHSRGANQSAAGRPPLKGAGARKGCELGGSRSTFAPLASRWRLGFSGFRIFEAQVRSIASGYETSAETRFASSCCCL